jgi:hypothetical protein
MKDMGFSGKAATASGGPDTKQKVVITSIAERYRVIFFIFLCPPFMMVRVIQTGHQISHKAPVWSSKKDVVRKSWKRKDKIPELLSDEFIELSQSKFFVQVLGKRETLFHLEFYDNCGRSGRIVVYQSSTRLSGYVN